MISSLAILFTAYSVTSLPLATTTGSQPCVITTVRGLSVSVLKVLIALANSLIVSNLISFAVANAFASSSLEKRMLTNGSTSSSFSLNTAQMNSALRLRQYGFLASAHALPSISIVSGDTVMKKPAV